MPITSSDAFIITQVMTNQTDATDGVWINFRNVKTFSIHILTFSGSDAVQVRVSCEPTIPNNNTHGVQLGSTITADRIVSSASNRFRWLKLRKTVGGGSATNAHLFGEYGEG